VNATQAAGTNLERECVGVRGVAVQDFAAVEHVGDRLARQHQIHQLLRAVACRNQVEFNQQGTVFSHSAMAGAYQSAPSAEHRRPYRP
jgi:hypothetical protein